MEKLSRIIGQAISQQDTRIRFKIHNAREFCETVFSDFNLKMEWLPEYDKIVRWMDDNNGLGLIMYGGNGRGKTVFARNVIPAFFWYFLQRRIPFYNATDINDRLDEVLQKKLVILDDIGVEDMKIDFGEKRYSFPEIMDNAEKNGNLVVATTNLTPELIEQKYGIRTRERIRSCCYPVKFEGKSLRTNK